METYYIITTFRNDEPYSYLHSDKCFYAAVVLTKGCNLCRYKSKTYAINKAKKIHFKGTKVGVLEVKPITAECIYSHFD